MQVKDKIMYHIHRSNDYDNLWKAGNNIEVDDSYYGYATRIIDEFNTFSPLTQEETLDTTIHKYLQNKELDQKELVRLLIETRAKIYDTNIFKREIALEEVRKEMFNHLPSRKHSLFVITKEGIDYWKNSLVPQKKKHTLALFQLSLTGNLFQSSADLLPHTESSFQDAKKYSINYWNPDLTFTDGNKDEYLFQGKAQIIKQLKL